MIELNEKENLVIITGSGIEIMCDMIVLFKNIIEDEKVFNILTNLKFKKGKEETEQFKYHNKIVSMLKELKGEIK